jgi:hypothetical protein
LQDLDDIDTYDSSVINCLQDYSNEIKSQECKNQVRKYVILASQDIRFDVPLAEACYEDRQKLCGNVPAVRGGQCDNALTFDAVYATSNMPPNASGFGSA